jgi:hypothetical protein
MFEDIGRIGSSILTNKAGRPEDQQSRGASLVKSEELPTPCFTVKNNYFLFIKMSNLDPHPDDGKSLRNGWPKSLLPHRGVAISCWGVAGPPAGRAG